MHEVGTRQAEARLFAEIELACVRNVRAQVRLRAELAATFIVSLPEKPFASHIKPSWQATTLSKAVTQHLTVAAVEAMATAAAAKAFEKTTHSTAAAIAGAASTKVTATHRVTSASVASGIAAC